MTRRSCANCYVGDQWLSYRYCPACWRAIRIGLMWMAAVEIVAIAFAMVVL